MSDALLWLSYRLGDQGRHDEARAVLERQLEQPEPGYLDYMSLREFYRATGELTALNGCAGSENQKYASLALSYALIGDWSTADAWLQRSRREFPDWPWAPFQVALVPGWQGRFAEVARQFRQVLAERQRSVESLTTDQKSYFGVALARAGEYEDAIGILAPLVAGAPLGAIHPDERYAPHALAWSYLQTGARDEAVRILSPAARECGEREAAGRLRTSRIRHLCAETELLLGNTEKALAGLEQAISAGWREYYLRERDPYWAALRDHPRYPELMAKVKAAVDRQRAEIQAIDARENFGARLDAAMAARARDAR